MEEFTKEMIANQNKIIQDTFEIIELNKDKYSEKAITNFNITIQHILKLACSLMLDVQTGKIHKAPSKYRNWKNKKNAI